jgi:alpha-galactosidase
MKNLHSFSFKNHSTIFQTEENKGTMLNLFGLSLTGDIPDEISDLFELISDNNKITSKTLKDQKFSISDSEIKFEWETFALIITSSWRYFPEHGIFRRQDKIKNKSDKPIKISRYLYRYAFSPANYDFYYQNSCWCNENQGTWQKIEHGTFQIGSHGGRFTREASPFVCLRDISSSKIVSFNLMCNSDWIIKIKRQPFGLPPFELSSFVTVEAGICDDNLAMVIFPGETIIFPELLIQVFSENLNNSSIDMQEHLYKNEFSNLKFKFPIVYNTWFDCFDQLSTNRLEKQVIAAKKIGCDIFVVDSGWYGRSSGNWSEQVGDWREKLGSAFDGKMKAFVEMVHKHDLKFGLWMEPERYAANVPARLEHPDWFLPGEDGFYYPDLMNKAAYEYIYNECSRLIEDYQLAWIKIDYNFGFGDDPRRSSFKWYYDKFYTLLDDLRIKYPDTIFEGCSSGGMRLEINNQKHFDTFLFSDDMNSFDILANIQNANYRLLTSRLSVWSVLRSAGKCLVPYGSTPETSPESFWMPSANGATWEHSEKVSLDFSCSVAMLGIMGFSGDLDSLSANARSKVAEYVSFYKKHLHLLTKARTIWLTEPRLKGDRNDWVALLKFTDNKKEAILFCFRLSTTVSSKRFFIPDLNENASFAVSSFEGEHLCVLTGRELCETGIQIDIENPYSSKIFVIQKKDKTQ